MPEATMFIEKRATRRVSEKIPVKYRLIDDPQGFEAFGREKKEEKTTQSRDISLGGCFIAAEQFFNIGSTLRLDFSFPSISSLISAFAEVIWANESGGGLKFIAIKEEDEKTLKNYIDKIA